MFLYSQLTKFLMIFVVVVATLPSAWGASRAQFRFLSFVIRDRPPSVEEAQAFRSGTKSVEALVAEWLESPEHRQRVKRYFGDMFGVSSEHRPVDWAFVLWRDESTGVYYRDRESGPCDPSLAIDRQAWWQGPSDPPLPICPDGAGENLAVDVAGVYTPCTSSQVWQDGCGCGPKLIGCIDYANVEILGGQMRDEFAERAAYAYGEGLGWEELFGGNYFYGTRLLYWKYLHANKIALGGIEPNAEEWQSLEKLSLVTPQVLPYPSAVPRFGVVTMPGFLLQHNNFRTRIRSLSENMLCQPVGAPLNTGGIAYYLNPDLSEEDLAHSNNEQCARCHYPMDNLGSMIFGYNTLGEWNPLTVAKSQIGHAFGIDGEGPRFLLRGFVERGPGFLQCMATRAWEDFSGTQWQELTGIQQQSLMSLAAESPRKLLRTLLSSTLLANLGIDSGGNQKAGAMDWQEVAGTVSNSCGGGSCHGATSFNTTYVDQPTNFLANGSSIAKRLKATDATKMPPLSSKRLLSDEERVRLLEYLGVADD